MTRDTVTQTLLETKRSNTAEYFVNLFEHCNLRCAFCWQDHTSTVGMSTILAKAQVIIDAAIESGKTAHTINLMGGELFSDEISNDLFSDYKQLVGLVNTNLTGKGHTVVFNFVTNLVFTKYERVRELLTYLQGKGITTHLTSSWDATGRFNGDTENLFFTNLEHFISDVRIVSVVLTKQCIDWFTSLNSDKSSFERLRSMVPVYFDTYSPEHRADRMAPKASDLKTMYLHLLDKYPETHPVASWADQKSITMNCRSSVIIGPTGYQGGCGALVPEKIKNDMAVPVEVLDNVNIENTFVDKNDCLSCEFFDRCGLGCFLLQNMSKFNDLDDCLYKDIHRKIGDNNA